MEELKICEYCGQETEDIINNLGDMICSECYEETMKELNPPDDHEADYWDRIIDERRGK